MDFMQILMAFGGLGMFLYGMQMMSDGLERVAGNKLKTLLAYLTKNRFIGMLVGALFTMIIQSSSATTVMVVGFVNAGLMNLIQAASVIMGANIGTTITSQIIALDIMGYAPILILAGVILSMAKKKRLNQWSEVIFGFGLLFVGLDLLGSNLKPLAEIEGFKQFMIGMSNPILAILAGAIFTAVVQSSSASIGVLQAFASQGLIGLGSSVYILMGQNIGTCITAMLSSINTSKTARRTAVMHLLFNVFGTLAFSIIINLIPIVPFFERIFADNPMQQIAAAHITFNVLGVVFFLPLIKLLVRAATALVPGEDKLNDELTLKYIDDRLITTPNIAVGQVRKEILRMGNYAKDNLALAVNTLLSRDESAIDKINETETVINYLEHEITLYLVKLNQADLSDADAAEVGSFFHVVNDIERIGDHAQNISDYLKTVLEHQTQLSCDSMDEIKAMHEAVQEALSLALRAFESRNKFLLDGVYPLEAQIDKMEKDLTNNHIERLMSNTCTARSGMIFTDIASNLERVGDHATNIAYSIKA